MKKVLFLNEVLISNELCILAFSRKRNNNSLTFLNDAFNIDLLEFHLYSLNFYITYHFIKDFIFYCLFCLRAL